MRLSKADYIKFVAKIRKASVSLSNIFAQQEQKEMTDIENFQVHSKLRPEIEEELKEIASANKSMKKMSAKKKKDYSGYYEDTNPFEDMSGSDGEDAKPSSRKSPLSAREDDSDLIDEVSKDFVAHEEFESPEQDPTFAPELKKEKTRLDIIKERAEALVNKRKRKSVVPVAKEEAEKEIIIEEPTPEAEAEETTPVAEEVIEEIKEAPEAEGGDEEESNDDEEHRGRKKGQKGEGRQIFEEITKIDDLRPMAYGVESLDAYGFSDRQIDDVFDIPKFIEKLKQTDPKRAASMEESGDEPEPWEMVEQHVDKAPKSLVKKIENLIEEVYEKQSELEIKRMDSSGKPSKPEVMKKKSKKVKEKNDKKLKVELKALSAIKDLNDLEGKFIEKYFRKKKELLERDMRKEEGAREAREEESADMEMLKRIQEKDKASK
jgi:hypothetical protein